MLVMLSNKRKKAKQDLKAYESPQPLSTDELVSMNIDLDVSVCQLD